jgi:hypothetical protein
LGQVFLLDFVAGLLVMFLELLETGLYVESGSVGSLLLEVELLDFLLDLVQLSLFGYADAFRLIVFLFDLTQLDRHLANFFGIVLEGR